MKHGILVVAGLIALACGGDVKVLSNRDPDAGGERDCQPGTEHCRCYGNETCNDGLVCGSNLCVKIDGATFGEDASLTPPGVGGKSGSGGGRGASGGSAGARNAGGASADGGTIDGSTDGDGGAGPDAGRGGSGGAKGSGSAGGDDAGTAGPVAIYIMLDRSASMLEPPPGQTLDSWTSSVNSLTAFVTDQRSSGLDIGLGGFPSGPTNTFDCATGADCGVPVVPIASLPNNAQPIISALSAQKPAGLALTPTECALRGMINQCLTYTSRSFTGEKCVAVLVTDGTPTQCDLDNNNLVKIITEGKAKGVDTYTLGLPGSDVNILNGYAMAGGTGMAIDVSAGPAAFIAALNAIRGRVTHTTMP